MFRVGILGMGRGVNRVITRKAPDGKGYQPRSQVRPARAKGQRRDLRPRPPLSNANQRGEPGCQKLTFYPAGRTEKQQTPAPRRRSLRPSAQRDPAPLPRRPKCRPDFAPAPAPNVRTRQRRQRYAPCNRPATDNRGLSAFAATGIATTASVRGAGGQR